MQALPRPTLYDQLLGLPEGLTGEILAGQLHTQPRPGGRHLRAEFALGNRLYRHYDDGGDGPGGWWMLMEPELHLRRDTEVAVPDLAGWRRQRMPQIPGEHRFEVIPDWICEVLSPSTAGKDREIKMPLYARYGVTYLWLLDPLHRTLEAYTANQGQWRLTVRAGGDEAIQAPPFDAVTLDLTTLWY